MLDLWYIMCNLLTSIENRFPFFIYSTAAAPVETTGRSSRCGDLSSTFLKSLYGLTDPSRTFQYSFLWHDFCKSNVTHPKNYNKLGGIHKLVDEKI